MFTFFRVVGNGGVFVQRDEFCLLDFVQRVVHGGRQVDVFPVRGFGEYPVQRVGHGHPVVAGFVFIDLFVTDVGIAFLVIDGLAVVEVQIPG